MRTGKRENDKDETVAEEVAVMDYTAPGTETFTSSPEKGSGFVLHHVFRRLMEDEKKRVWADKDLNSLITPGNHSSEIVGTERLGSSWCESSSVLSNERAHIRRRWRNEFVTGVTTACLRNIENLTGSMPTVFSTPNSARSYANNLPSTSCWS